MNHAKSLHSFICSQSILASHPKYKHSSWPNYVATHQLPPMDKLIRPFMNTIHLVGLIIVDLLKFTPKIVLLQHLSLLENNF